MNDNMVKVFIKSGVTPLMIEQSLRCSSGRKDGKHQKRIGAFCKCFKIDPDDLTTLAARWGIPL